MEDIFDLELQRIIGQIRFRPTLASYSEVSKIAGKLEGEFEEWRVSKSDDITLYSPEKKEFLQMGSDNITYVNESEDERTKAQKLIEAATDDFIKNCSIEEIRRVGFRNTQVFSCKVEFEELVDLIYKKFYSSTKTLKNISADTPKDVVFVLDGLKNGFLNHINIGPVKSVEARKYFGSGFEDEIKLGESNLFVDIDVFAIENLKKDKIFDTLNSTMKESKRLMDDYLKYIKS